MRVPAVCDSCGALFPSGFEAVDSHHIGFQGVPAGPCPVCGQRGHILDGVYNFVGNTIELLSGPSRTIAELQRLSSILTRAKEQQLSFQDVTEEINQQLPELSSIRDVLPKTRNELYAFIAIIISTIALIVSQTSSHDQQKIEVTNIINNIYQQQMAVPDLKMKKIAPRQKKKIGRNERCPCGSGVKYKKCCLLQI